MGEALAVWGEGVPEDCPDLPEGSGKACQRKFFCFFKEGGKREIKLFHLCIHWLILACALTGD